MAESEAKETVTLYAFLIEAPASGIPLFSQTTMIPASEEELKEKIRMQANCMDAEVVIVPPEKWNPPKLNSVSQQELTIKFSQILMCVQQSMKRLGLPEMPTTELIQKGLVMPNPVSGKVFFVFKIEGSLIQKRQRKWWQFWR